MTTRNALVGACVMALLGGCGGSPDAGGGWEHARGGLYDAALSSDGRFAAVSSVTDGASLWDLTANARRFDWRHGDGGEGAIRHIAFAPDGSHVITADERTFVVWDTRSGQALGFWAVDSPITAVAIADDARYVLLGLEDGRAIHVDQRSGRRLEVVAHGGRRVTRVELAADGVVAASGGDDGRVAVWNAMTGDELHAFDHPARIVIVRFDPAGRRVLTADKRGHVYIWDLASGAKLATLELPRRQRAISAARFSADGTRLVLGFPGGDVRLWDSASARELRAWRAPQRRQGWVPQRPTIYAVAFGDGGASVVAEASNGLGRAWPTARSSGPG